MEFHEYGIYCCEIEIPEDALCHIETHKIKADKIIIKKFELTKNLSLWSNSQFREIAIKQNGLLLEYVKEQTSELCEMAVKQHG
jgi:hypothetical protein